MVVMVVVMVMVMVMVMVDVMMMVVMIPHVLGVEPPGEEVGGGHHASLPRDETVQVFSPGQIFVYLLFFFLILI